MNLSAQDFDYVRQLKRSDSSNRIDDGKEYLVLARLGPVAAGEGFDNVGELLEAIRRGDRRLRAEAVEAMTINETSFFRDPHIYATLRSHILPELFARSPHLRIWSAAAATGQEPYSVALMIADDFPQAGTPQVLGTDLSRRALARAESGEFTQLEVNRGLPARSLVRHFTQSGRTWRIDEKLRRQVRFQYLNLAGPWPQLPAQDLILLRNVLIYFDEATRQHVFARAAQQLRPGGFLVLGSSEALPVGSAPVERVMLGRTLCYRAA